MDPTVLTITIVVIVVVVLLLLLFSTIRVVQQY